MVARLSGAAMILGALTCAGWWIFPAQPAPVPWPAPSPAIRDRLAQQFFDAVRQEWAAGRPLEAWRAAQVLLEDFPGSPQARQVRPARDQLEQAARRQAGARKWHYTLLGGRGWGVLAQAQLQAEPAASPSSPTASLVIRQGSQPGSEAVFLVPEGPLPDSCSQPRGCLVEWASAATSWQARLMPVPDKAGWWYFPDHRAMMARLGGLDPLALHVAPAPAAPWVFDTSGLDRTRMEATPRGR